jgi:hypothetical protein
MTPLCPASVTLDLLFLVTFSVFAVIINVNPVCITIIESAIDRTI